MAELLGLLGIKSLRRAFVRGGEELRGLRPRGLRTVPPNASPPVSWPCPRKSPPGRRPDPRTTPDASGSDRVRHPDASGCRTPTEARPAKTVHASGSSGVTDTPLYRPPDPRTPRGGTPGHENHDRPPPGHPEGGGFMSV